MKKYNLVAIIVLSISLAFAACGQSNSQNPAASSPVSSEPMESVDTPPVDTDSNEESIVSKESDIMGLEYESGKSELDSQVPDIVVTSFSTEIWNSSAEATGDFINFTMEVPVHWEISDLWYGTPFYGGGVAYDTDGEWVMQIEQGRFVTNINDLWSEPVRIDEMKDWTRETLTICEYPIELMVHYDNRYSNGEITESGYFLDYYVNIDGYYCPIHFFSSESEEIARAEFDGIVSTFRIT